MEQREIKYFLYARKSSESEDRQMASIADQIKEVQGVAENLGLTVVDVITESKSAKEPGRPAFNAMLTRIHKGEAQGILCWKLNRLARNPVDGGQISWMLQQGIIKHIQCFGRDYKPTDNVIMMQVEFGMANQYVKDLSVDIQRGMRQKAERGWYPHALLPLGYRHNKDNLGNPLTEEITPDQQFPIIKRLWKLMLTGSCTIAEIQRIGDAEGLLGKSGKPIARSSYYELFANRFYCGYFKWRDSRGGTVEYRGKHKPMVSEVEFLKVQDILGNRNSDTRQRNYNFPFKGVLKCGECGCSITAEWKHNTRCTDCGRRFSLLHRNCCPRCGMAVSAMKNPRVTNAVYYHCTKKRGTCSQKCITQDELFRQYRNVIERLTISKELYQLLMLELKALNTKEHQHELDSVTRLKQRATKLKNRLDELGFMRADREVTEETYGSMRRVTEAELLRVTNKLKVIRHDVTHWDLSAQGHLKLCQKALMVLDSGDSDAVRAMVKSLGSKQLLMAKKLSITGFETLKAIEKCGQEYQTEKRGFETQNRLDLQGDSGSFRPPKEVMWSWARLIRTACIRDLEQQNEQYL